MPAHRTEKKLILPYFQKKPLKDPGSLLVGHLSWELAVSIKSDKPTVSCVEAIECQHQLLSLSYMLSWSENNQCLALIIFPLILRNG